MHKFAWVEGLGTGIPPPPLLLHAYSYKLTVSGTARLKFFSVLGLPSSPCSMHVCYVPSIPFPADSSQGMSRNKSFGAFRREFEVEDVCGYIQSGVQVLCTVMDMGTVLYNSWEGRREEWMCPLNQPLISQTMVDDGVTKCFSTEGKCWYLAHMYVCM